MKILAIDTSSKVCSVSILEDEVVTDEIILDDGKTHSENLMPLLDTLLNHNSVNIQDIEMMAVCVGPGSFTGIRIGVSTVKAIANVLNIKIASVTSLEALARNIEAEKDQIIVPLIDARNNKVYAGVFDSDFNLIEEYMADDINNVIDVIKKYKNVLFIGDGAVVHKDLLTSNFENALFAKDNKQYSSRVGICGYYKMKKNELVDADSVVPFYMSKSQAERQKNMKENTLKNV